MCHFTYQFMHTKKAPFQGLHHVCYVFKFLFTPYLSPVFTGIVKVKEISICEEIGHRFDFQVAIIRIIFFKTNVFLFFFFYRDGAT